jgi:hypothetical protein
LVTKHVLSNPHLSIVFPTHGAFVMKPQSSSSTTRMRLLRVGVARGHLVGTRIRTRQAVGQRLESAIGAAGDPAVQGMSIDPLVGGDLGN